MKQEKIRNMVLTGLFIALVLILGMTPIGLIPLGFVNVTTLCIPVIVGAILLGPRTGLILGACFGLTSAISAFGLKPSALVAPLVAASPVLTLVMCFVPRLLVPVVAHVVYNAMAQGEARVAKAVPFAAVAGSLTNTILYLGIMLLLYALLGLDTASVLGIIGGTGLIAGVSEAVVAAILATPILAALWRVQPKKA